MDQNSVIKAVPALASAAKTADFTGITVDARGFNALTFVANTATVTDGTTTLGAEYSDDAGSNWSAVPAAEIIGTAPTFTTAAADDNAVKQFGVVVRHAHYRMKGTVAGATTGLVIGGVAILGHPSHAPTA